MRSSFECPVAACGRCFAAAQTLHIHVDSHRFRADSIPSDYYARFHRANCPSCLKSYSLSRQHVCSNNPNTTSSSQEEIQLPTSISSFTSASIVSQPALHDFDDILSVQLPICRHIPKSCRDLFAEALSNLCSQAARNPRDHSKFRLLFMFPRAVLRAPPRGGKRRRVHFSRLLSERLRRWLSGDYEALWSEATCASKAPKRTLEEQADSLEKRCERAKALTQEGNLSKACSALLSCGIADVNPSVLCDLRSKHPSRPTAVKLPVTSLPPSIQMTRDEVAVGIRSFPAASGAGPSKLFPDHLREALKCATPLKSERLLDEITSLVNIWASGEVCPSLATRICAAYLHPLLKKDGGIRPVAVGETFRRLVSKCLNSAIRKEAASILSPLQLGVGVRGGCEIAIHSLRSVVDKLGSDDRTCLMKIDFKNAFNVISRQTVLNQVHSLFPGILWWSSFCPVSYTHLTLPTILLV